MVDIVDRATRSRMMSGIRGKDTKPEIVVRSFLHRSGLRFRLHAKLPGKPDLIFPKYKTVVFVHGCFWHRHKNCRFATSPSTNAEFWKEKFDANVRRDRSTTTALRKLRWKVLLIWSCQTTPKKLSQLATKIKKLGAP